MRIDGPGSPKIGQKPAERAKTEAPSPGGGTTEPVAPASKVSLGQGATAALIKGDEISPAVQARLDEIKLQLQSGQYPIDLDRLATNIVDDELARGGRN